MRTTGRSCRSATGNRLRAKVERLPPLEERRARGVGAANAVDPNLSPAVGADGQPLAPGADDVVGRGDYVGMGGGGA